MYYYSSVQYNRRNCVNISRCAAIRMDMLVHAQRPTIDKCIES